MADTVVIPPFDKFAGTRGFANNLIAGLLQQQQQQRAARQLQQLGLPGGLTSPIAQQIGGQLAAAQAKPMPPTQRIVQKQLDRINFLEEKARRGTITKPEKAELQSAIRRVQPKTTFTPLQIERTKGHLEAGGETTIFGNVIPFVTRKSAINYAQRQLGPNWAQASPEAKEIIDRKWPAKGIRVISPDGSRGTIPTEDWQEAKRQGFRRR